MCECSEKNINGLEIILVLAVRHLVDKHLKIHNTKILRETPALAQLLWFFW